LDALKAQHLVRDRDDIDDVTLDMGDRDRLAELQKHSKSSTYSKYEHGKVSTKTAGRVRE
jgi:hypothetical protein